MKQTIVRKGTFDAGHRVMNEKMKCFNMHGHTYHYELHFEFTSTEEIGYAIDFKEIKRIGCQWIDDLLDHGMILNPEDHIPIAACVSTGSKLWLMSLNGKKQYCNPTAENLAKEIFLAMEILFDSRGNGLRIKEIILYETPNCFVNCTEHSIAGHEAQNFYDLNQDDIIRYAKGKGLVEYDDRKEVTK